MANALGEQVCPARLSAIIFGMFAHNTLREWLKIRDVAYHNNVNDGYALIDIAHVGVDGRDVNNATNALLWYKLALGIKVDDVYYERSKKVRARIADLVLNSTLSYSDKVSMVQACFKDLDVQLIHEALIQRFDKPTTYLNESMGDINTLLNNKVFKGTTQYAIGDIDTDGTVTSFTQDAPINVFIKDQVVSINTGKFTVNDNNNNPILEYATGSGTVKNLTSDRYFWVGANDVTDYYYVSSMTYLVAYKDNIYYRLPLTGGRRVGVAPNSTVPLWSIASPDPKYPSVTASSLQNYFTGAYFRVIEQIDAPIEDGDKDHWLRLKDENWDLFITSRYISVKYYAHVFYDTYKPIIYNRGYMNSKRIRMVDLNVVQGVSSVDDRPVMVHAQTKFTTDFKYIKKDPNGQFLAGGMDRCPAFAGQSSNGIIPDNPNLGHGFILLNQSSVSMNGGINPKGIPFNRTALSSSTGTWNFTVNIPEKIVLPTPSDGTTATTMWDDPTFNSMNPNMYAITNFPMEYTTYVYSTRTRFSYSAQAQKLASTGGNYYTIQRNDYGRSRYLNTVYQYLNWIDGTTPIMEIVPNMYYFALKNTATNEWYIPAGFLQLKIANSLDFLTGARSVFNVGGTSPDILTWANQMNSVSRANSFQVRLKFDWSGLYGHVPPTNFDFAETV